MCIPNLSFHRLRILFETQTQGEKDLNLKLFLLSRYVCGIPDKGKNLRYPHTYPRLCYIINPRGRYVNPIINVHIPTFLTLLLYYKRVIVHTSGLEYSPCYNCFFGTMGVMIIVDSGMQK